MILVMGATGTNVGNVGRRVLHGLLAKGAPVRAMDPDPSEAADLPPQVEVVRGDLSDPDSLGPAFNGIERMYMLAIAGYDVLDSETAAQVLVRARKAGVRRVVLMSASGTPLVEVEEPVRESGISWTFLRPGEFASNSVDYWGDAIRAGGPIKDTYLDVRCVPVHEEDIADVAVAALLEDGHDGAIHTMTGPESISRRDQLRTIGKALGRDIPVEDLTPDQARVHMRAQGWPDEIIDHLFTYYSAWTDDPPAVLPTVEKVTGRPGRTFAQWCSEHASVFT
ncbi:NAD(P)H-binding protein [Spirillospora sp. NPDC047279]|uniref:NAD(P)H-binding protein n=1 Tax=Spirillospora sp. NPDC047279 TaxID=3155478 RepID=UPI0033EA29A5